MRNCPSDCGLGRTAKGISESPWNKPLLYFGFGYICRGLSELVPLSGRIVHTGESPDRTLLSSQPTPLTCFFYLCDQCERARGGAVAARDAPDEHGMLFSEPLQIIVCSLLTLCSSIWLYFPSAYVCRVHRQLVSMFARGPEPTQQDSASSSLTSMDHPPQDDRGDEDDLISSPK